MGRSQAGINDLENHTTEIPLFSNKNVLPHIDVFTESGYTKEEIKMIEETRKILRMPDLRVTATTVRVPIKHSHAVSLLTLVERDFDLADIRQAFQEAEGYPLG